MTEESKTMPLRGAEEPNRDDVLDAVVVGAGWAGIYMVHQLRQLGLSVRAFEAGKGVGGTWYWNRYPGARCDAPSLHYMYTFSEEIWWDWDWSEKYSSQPEIERYANFVVDRLGLRSTFTFDTFVSSATFDERHEDWVIETDTGERVRARFCFMATGGYSKPHVPDFEGLEDFAGELYVTSMWPDTDVEFDGKRIGVVGTGSSGMQAISEIAQRTACEHLYVFQRTANFTTPGWNRPTDRAESLEFKNKYDEFRTATRGSGAGILLEAPGGPVAALSDGEFKKRMDAGWAAGGPATLAGISDYAVDEAANERVAEYIRERIRERVTDPTVAELLCPKGHFLGARRILVENGYFEVYNRPNVTLIDVRRDPIVRLTRDGVETAAGEIPLDMLILATGFDSGTGAVLGMDITGRDGLTMAEAWGDGPQTYLGLQVAGFPNMFFIAGPGSPSIRSNVMVSIEQHVEWLSDLMAHLKANEMTAIEASPKAQQQWTEHCAEAVNATLMARNDSQYLGANIPGKPRVYLAYVGGVKAYRLTCDQVAHADYEGFILSKHGVELPGRSDSWSGPPNDPNLVTRFGAPLGALVI